MSRPQILPELLPSAIRWETLRAAVLFQWGRHDEAKVASESADFYFQRLQLNEVDHAA